MENAAILTRVNGLIGTASGLLSQPIHGEYGGGWVSNEGYAGWRAQSLAAIAAIVGDDSIYYKEFETRVANNNLDRVESGKGILVAFRNDIVNGYLNSYRDLVIGEVFTELLDSASQLLEQKYKDAAGSIAGAVLENGLRDLLAKHGGDVGRRGNLQSLSQVCFQKQLVTALEHKNLQAWIALRDHADHGQFAEYEAGDVKRMIDGVTDFLSRHLR